MAAGKAARISQIELGDDVGAGMGDDRLDHLGQDLRGADGGEVDRGLDPPSVISNMTTAKTVIRVRMVNPPRAVKSRSVS